MIDERRKNRSKQAHVALEYLLQAEASRRDARTMAIGTVDGLPIACWGADDPCQVAALGSLRAAGRRAPADQELIDLNASLIASAYGPLVLTWCGAESPPRAQLGADVARIMS